MSIHLISTSTQTIISYPSSNNKDLSLYIPYIFSYEPQSYDLRLKAQNLFHILYTTNFLISDTDSHQIVEQFSLLTRKLTVKTIIVTHSAHQSEEGFCDIVKEKLATTQGCAFYVKNSNLGVLAFSSYALAKISLADIEEASLSFHTSSPAVSQLLLHTLTEMKAAYQWSLRTS